MEDTLIRYKTAKLAKEKGFNKGALAYYCLKLGENEETANLYYNSGFEYMKSCSVGDLIEDFNSINTREDIGEWSKNFIYLSAPTQSLLQRWLREVHNIHIAILPKILPSNEIKYYCFKGKMKKDFGDLYDTYEEALEIGLYRALELIKNE